MSLFREVDLRGADNQIDTSTLVFSIMAPVPIEKTIDWCLTCDSEAIPSDSGIDWWTPGCRGEEKHDVVCVDLVRVQT